MQRRLLTRAVLLLPRPPVLRLLWLPVFLLLWLRDLLLLLPLRLLPLPLLLPPLRVLSILSLPLLVATTMPALAAGASFDLPALSALLAQRKSAEATFTEERNVSGLDAPLRASGTLSFTAPDRFSRTTLAPRPEVMSVAGNTVTLQRGGRSRQIQLDAVPELTALVEAIRGTLNGDVATLQKYFKASVDGSAAQWTLTLMPSDSRLAAQVRELQIVGQGSQLRTVELWLAGGDHSLMRIEPLAAAR